MLRLPMAQEQPQNKINLVCLDMFVVFAYELVARFDECDTALIAVAIMGTPHDINHQHKDVVNIHCCQPTVSHIKNKALKQVRWQHFRV